MSATGLNPFDDDTMICIDGYQVTRRVLDEYDRLMAQGGIDAVVEALKKEQEGR